MRDFEWYDDLWIVIKEDGTFAGRPCVSYEEARELSAQHEGSHFYMLNIEMPRYDNEEDENEKDEN